MPTGLAFSDSTNFDVDGIVYGTGFKKDSRKFIAPIVGTEHATALEPVWGLDVRRQIVPSPFHRRRLSSVQ
ncbi:hypothetical protein B0H10DRAFT_2209725 [Mycena sp. CBHHK59/15]|nr:hypothetical protein B0H10DRAFT_2209725 [Mycena sp. CBHHK59/15]